MKIAIFHNYMDNIGGAEIVSLTFARELNADIYTTLVNKHHIANVGFANVLPRIHSIGKIPKQAPFKQQLVFWKFRRLNLKNKYDFYIISGDWAMSAAVKNKPNLWYVHSPLNEIWQFRDAVREKMVARWKHPIFDLWVWFNRKLTLSYARHVNNWVCNSANTRERIKKFYGASATVIYPPIDTTKYKNTGTGNYWLSVNRLIDHKRVEIQLDAFSKLPHERLIVVGSYEKDVHQFEKYRHGLEQKKPANVTFREWISDADLIDLYAGCKGFITTARDEDFGMTAVEALASGKMVIAPNEGGYKESVIDGKTGFLIDDITPEKLAATIQKAGDILAKNPDSYTKACLKQATKFDTKKCIAEIKKETNKKERVVSMQNNYTGTYPMVYHQPGDSKNLPSNRFLQLIRVILDGPAQQFGCPDDLTIVTWNNRDTSALERTCEHLGIPLKIYGKNITEWKNNYQTKLRLMRDACLHEKTTYIMGLDARDVALIAPPSVVLDTFKKMNVSMLFGGEGVVDGGSFYKNMPDLNYFFKLHARQEKDSGGSPFVYLNAGQWIAERAVALAFFEKAMTYPPRRELPDSDQALLADMLSKEKSFQSAVKIDYRCRIFQVSVKTNGIISFLPPYTISKNQPFKKIKARVNYSLSILLGSLGVKSATAQFGTFSLTTDSYIGKIGTAIKKISPEMYIYLKKIIGEKNRPAKRTHRHDEESVRYAVKKAYDSYSHLGILSVYFFGSIVRDDYVCEKSDIDIIAIVTDSFPKKKSNRITKMIKRQVPWLDKININYIGIGELSGGERRSRLMQVFTAEAILLSFQEWKNIAGRIYSFNDFSLVPYSEDEAIGFHKAKAMHNLVTKDAIIQRGKLGLKMCPYVCHHIHRKKHGAHPFSRNTLIKYSTDETREMINVILQLSEMSYDSVEVFIRLPTVMKFLTSVHASYPNRHFKPFFKEVLPALTRAGLPHWVFGGVGVAGIAGYFLRENKDIDLCVRENDFEAACTCLMKICEMKNGADSWKFVQRFEKSTKRPKGEIYVNGVERLSLIPVYENEKEVIFKMGGTNVPMIKGGMTRTEKKIGDISFYIPQESIILDILRTVTNVHINAAPEQLLSPDSREYRHWIDVAAVLSKEEFDELYRKANEARPSMLHKIVDRQIGRMGIMIKKISPKTYQLLKKSILT